MRDKPNWYLIFFIGWLLFILALAGADKAFASSPGVHSFDPKFALEYAATWNAKHPKAPITDMACYHFAQFSAKQAGVPGSSASSFVPAHEDCMVTETFKKGTLCGELTIKPRFQANNPDAALLSGERLPCKQVRAAIASARNANSSTA